MRAAELADAIDGVQPALVVEPGTVEEASGVLRLANEQRLAVAPRGGGSKLGLGNLPERLDLILSTRRLNRVLEHAAGDLVVRLEAGAVLADVQRELTKASQWLALDPPEPGATVGGIVATNASGSHRLRYGTPRDLLIGLTYILPDGTVARSGGKVVKNVAGYDLGKLFTGSLGSLGLIVETIFRLHPLPRASRTMVARVERPAQLGDATQALLHSSLVPSAIDFRIGASGELLVRFEGVEPGVVAQAEMAGALLQPFGTVEVLDGSDKEAIWRSQARLTLDTQASEIKISAPIATLPEVIADARKLGAAEPIYGHAGSGITYLQLDAGAETIENLRARVARRGGSLVVQHAPATLKHQIDVWGDGGTALPLMRRVKECFDPNRVMNPGRQIGRL